MNHYLNYISKTVFTNEVLSVTITSSPEMVLTKKTLFASLGKCPHPCNDQPSFRNVYLN